MPGRFRLLALFVVLACWPAVAAADVHVGGRVLAPGGAPLAEVEVSLVPLHDPLLALEADLELRSAEPVARTLSGDDGRFALGAPHAGLWRIVIRAKGFVPLETMLLPLIEPLELPDAELTADAGFHVKVTGRDGAALAGARVRLETEPSRIRFAETTWRFPVRGGVTAADGTLRLPRGEREQVALSVYAEDHGFRERRGLYGDAARFDLKPAPSRAIEVRSASGRPEPGVLVAAGPRGLPLGRTDEAGRTGLAVEPGSRLRLTLLAEDRRRLETESSAPAPSEDRAATYVLPARSLIAGRLIDAESRRPVEAGLVWDLENPMESAVTDRVGGFVLGGVALQRLRITAGAPGYLPAEPFEHQLNDDGRPGPTLPLRPAAAVEGLVVDEDGRPVPGADLELEVLRQSGMVRIEIGRAADLPRARTSPQGTFRLSPVDPRNGYEMKVRAEGFAPAGRVVTDLQPYRTKAGLKVTLLRGRALRGTVVDGEGRGLGEASVVVSPSLTRQGIGGIEMVSGAGRPEGFEAVTDREGRFAVAGLPAGRFDLVASRSGFAKHKMPGIEIEEGSGPVEIGEIVLQPGERLEGMTLDRDGRPLEGVEVRVTEAGPMMMFFTGPGPLQSEPDAVSDPGGWFAVDDLSAGTRYTLALRRTGFTEKSVSGLELPRVEPVEVVLDPASDVSGVVLDAGGEPVPGAQVNLERERTIEMGGSVMVAMMLQGATSDAEGRFLFEDQEPGRISLGAVASGFQEAKLDDLEIPAGADLEGVELTLPAGAIVEGRVLAPDGRPAIGATVRPVTEMPELVRIGGSGTDGNGYYRLEGLEPGPLSVEATHDEYPRVVRDLEAREGINRLDLAFEGGQPVSGRVVSVEGAPVAQAAVRLAQAGRTWGGPETVTQGDGRFVLGGVQDGEYSLWVDSEGFAPSAGEVEIEVAGAPVEGLEVRLDPGGAITGRVTGLDPEQFRNVRVSAQGAAFRGLRQSDVDFEGRYRVEHLPPGSYSVVATLADSGRRAKGQATLEAGAPEIRLDLQFGQGLTLSGRTVQGEAPIVGATVFAEGTDSDHSGWSQTDLEGRFSIEGLEPGGYRLLVRNFQTGLAHDETVELATSREIVIEVPSARVAGRVVDSADRRPLPGVSLVLEDNSGGARGILPLHTATTDLEGRFRIEHIADGDWKLSASKEGYAALSRPVAVQHGSDVDGLQLSMDATEGLTLEARLPSGAPPNELTIAVLDPAGGSLLGGNYATGENGRVRLSSVPPGSWELVVAASGSAATRVTARAPGPTVPVALQPACGLSVAVPELSDPASVAAVRLSGVDGRPFVALSWSAQPRSEWRMTGGRIELASLPPGVWTVDVSTGDGRNWQGSVSTAPGPAAALTLE